MSALVQIRPLKVSALVLENSPGSPTFVEKPYGENRCRPDLKRKDARVLAGRQGRSLGREKGSGEPSLLADVALTEESRASRDAGSTHLEPSCSSDQSERA